MNKRAIMLPFIFVYKTLFYIIKTPIVILKYFGIGLSFLVWALFVYFIINVLKGTYITIQILLESLFYFCKCFIIGFRVIFGRTDDVILALGNNVCRGFIVSSILIYKLFRPLRYVFKGLVVIIKLVVTAIIYLSMYFYKGLDLIIKAIITICLYFYYGIRLIGKNIIGSLLRYIILGLSTSLYLVYQYINKLFHYFFKGVKSTLEMIVVNPYKNIQRKIEDNRKKAATKVAIKSPKKIIKPQPTVALKKKPKESVYRPKVQKKKAKTSNIKKNKKRKVSKYKKRVITPKVHHQSKLFLKIYKFFFILTRKIYHFIAYIFIGIAFIFYMIYSFVRYTLIGIYLPFRLIFRFIGGPLQKVVINSMKSSKVRQEEKAVQRFLEKKERDQMHLEQIKAREDRVRRRAQEKRSRSMVLATVEKTTLKDKFKTFSTVIKNIPKRIRTRLKEEAKFSPLVQAFKNEQAVPGRQMVIDYEGIDAIKSNKKLLYEYIVRDPNTGKIVKGYFDAFSIVEVHSFLISEGYEVYSIKTSRAIQILHANVSVANRRIKTNDLIFMLTQLSTYIKAGLPLVDSLKILSRQYQKTKYLPIFKAIVYDLTMGENFSAALAKQNVAFPRLLINMVKTSEMTGELPEALDDMVNYYTETEQTRKQMISALTYPTIVLFMAIGVLTFIMLFVVPKFVGIYETMDNASIPGFTIFIMHVSDFMQANIIYIGIGIVVLIILMRYLYKNVKLFRYMFQWVGMHIPVMGQIVIYNEVTMFTKTFSSLLSHNVFITDSMEILSRVTSNEIYKILIANTIDNLNRGDRISMAFEHAWAFPIPAYEMLVTGEKTGQLPEMMKKVSDYYQDLHRNSVSRLKALIEPILIVFLTAVVGVIVMAVVIPMFNMYSSIQGV